MGREAELRRLEAALSQAVEGAGSIVFLAGESGIGKTALAGEFIRRARSLHTLTLCRGRCVELYGASEAYSPFLDALSGLLLGSGRAQTVEIVKRHAPTWARQLPTLGVATAAGQPLGDATAGASKERVLREVGDALEVTTAEFPMLLLLEDLQWADAASVDLLRFLGQRIARQRVLIVASYRPADLAEPRHPLLACVSGLRVGGRCQEIALEPLSPENVKAYLDARFPGHRFPAMIAEVVHTHTEGLPLFVASLVQFLHDRGDIVMGKDGWELVRTLTEADLQTPETVRDTIRRKVEALPEDDRVALQYGAVMGRQFLGAVVARLSGSDELAVEERLNRLHRKLHLIDAVGEEELPDGSLTTRYRFVHSAHQDVLYGDLLPQRRALMHRQVGEELVRRYGDQAKRLAAALAFHLERGRDFAGAVTYRTRAAENAILLQASAEARDHLSEALRLAEKIVAEGERIPRTLDLLDRRGTLEARRGRFEDALIDYSRMLEVARDQGSADAECAALGGMCNALFFLSRIEEMTARAEEAAKAAARTGSESRRLEADFLVAQTLQASGHLARSKTLLDGVLEGARRQALRPVLLRALAYRGTIHYWQSEYGRAEALLREGHDLAVALADDFHALASLMFRGLSLGELGRMSAARACFEEGIAYSRRILARFWLPRFISHMGWLHRKLHDFEGALAHDQEALRTSEEAGVEEATAGALLNLAIDYVQAGRLDEAAPQIEAIEQGRCRAGLYGWQHDARVLAVLAEYALRRGENARCSAYVQELENAAHRHQLLNYVQTAERMRAELALADGDPAAAGVHLAAIFEALRREEAPHTKWMAYATLGRALQAAGEGEKAQEAFRRAASLISSIADTVDDPGLRATYLASPEVAEVTAAARVGLSA